MIRLSSPTSTEVGSNSGVQLRYYDSGNSVFDTNTVNQTTSGNQVEPTLDRTDEGDYIVSFSGVGNQSGQQDSDGGVYYRIYSSSGSAITGETRVNDYTTGDQQMASVAALTSDHFVVTWSGASAADSNGVYFDLEINDVPVAAGGFQLIFENASYPIQEDDLGYFDAESDPLDHIRIDQLPARGSLLLNGVQVSAGDTISKVQIDNGDLEFRPRCQRIRPQLYLF